jgi:hypothetical protein
MLLSSEGANTEYDLNRRVYLGVSFNRDYWFELIGDANDLHNSYALLSNGLISMFPVIDFPVNAPPETLPVVLAPDEAANSVVAFYQHATDHPPTFADVYAKRIDTNGSYSELPLPPDVAHPPSASATSALKISQVVVRSDGRALCVFGNGVGAHSPVEFTLGTTDEVFPGASIVTPPDPFNSIIPAGDSFAFLQTDTTSRHRYLSKILDDGSIERYAWLDAYSRANDDCWLAADDQVIDALCDVRADPASPLRLFRFKGERVKIYDLSLDVNGGPATMIADLPFQLVYTGAPGRSSRNARAFASLRTVPRG